MSSVFAFFLFKKIITKKDQAKDLRAYQNYVLGFGFRKVKNKNNFKKQKKLSTFFVF